MQATRRKQGGPAKGASAGTPGGEALYCRCGTPGFHALERFVEVHRGTRIQRERMDRLLLHLFQHQIHHRGQAHAMLSSTHIRPPQLDEFFSIEEAPLRATEFTGLGWTEETVWRR